MKKSILILAMGVVIFVLSVSILTGEECEKDLKAIVEEIGEKAKKCFLNGDVDAMLEYYCDDIISMPNFHPMIRGKEKLKLMTEAIFKMNMKFESLESTTLEVKSGGDYVYEVGTYSQSIKMPDVNEPVKQKGKYVTIWKRQPDGQLKIAVEIYNSSEMAY